VAMPVRRVEAPAPRRRPPGTVRHPTPTRGAPRSGEPAETRETRPDLRVVPRRRAAVSAALLLLVVVVALMLAAVVLHTRLTERQLEMERREQEVTEAHERFDVLRAQRAELRAPTRLALASTEKGMIVAANTEFVDADGRTVAKIIAAAGTIDELTDAVDPVDPLDQIRRVKAAAEVSE
jgi:cell division protein FtsL